MSLLVKKIDADDNLSWLELVENHPQAKIYHHPAWAKAIEETIRHGQPHHLGIAEPSGQLVAILPGLVKKMISGRKVFESLPLTSFVPPLSQGEDKIRLFLNYLWKNSHWQKFELKLLKNEGFNFETELKCRQKYATHFLDISNSCSELWRQLHPTSIRQRIMKAKRTPFQFQEISDWQGLKIFFNLHALSRRRVGKPPLPRQFFASLWKNLIPAGLMRVLALKLNDHFVSALILLLYKKTAHAEYTATHPDYLKLNANQYITWKAIEIANDSGCEIFDLGRTDLSKKGLLEYKMRWGSKLVPLCYLSSEKDRHNKSNSFVNRLSKNVCRSLPIPVLKLVSEIYGKICY